MVPCALILRCAACPNARTGAPQVFRRRLTILSFTCWLVGRQGKRKPSTSPTRLSLTHRCRASPDVMRGSRVTGSLSAMRIDIDPFGCFDTACRPSRAVSARNRPHRPINRPAKAVRRLAKSSSLPRCSMQRASATFPSETVTCKEILRIVTLRARWSEQHELRLQQRSSLPEFRARRQVDLSRIVGSTRHCRIGPDSPAWHQTNFPASRSRSAKGYMRRRPSPTKSLRGIAFNRARGARLLTPTAAGSGCVRGIDIDRHRTGPTSQVARPDPEPTRSRPRQA